MKATPTTIPDVLVIEPKVLVVCVGRVCPWFPGSERDR
jgi:hypothetical protein